MPTLMLRIDGTGIHLVDDNYRQSGDQNEITFIEWQTERQMGFGKEGGRGLITSVSPSDDTDTVLFLGTHWAASRYDLGAGGWWVTESNIPGMNAEAPTMDELIAKLRVMIPEMVEVNKREKANG